MPSAPLWRKLGAVFFVTAGSPHFPVDAPVYVPMKLWQIAWKSIEHRSLASALTAFSMSLGVALVVTVIVIYGILSASFNRSAQGYNLVVGPKGSSLQLVLATMFYSQDAQGTIPYDYYKQLATGRYSPEVEVAVPIALGEHYKGVPIVATTPDFFDKLQYRDRHWYKFATGKNLDAGDDYCAVVGAVAAKKLNLKVGDTFYPGRRRTGNDEGEQQEFTIVGVLAPTYTPNDTALFLYLGGFFKLYTFDEESGIGTIFRSIKIDKGIGEGGGTETPEDARFRERRISAVLVMTKERETEATTSTDIWGAESNVNLDSHQTRSVMNTSVFALQRRIDNDLDAQAVQPIHQITFLLEKIVGNMQLVLIILAVLVVVVAGIGMMVSIYNSMNERRQEIAIMRALGARRTTVMGIILLESILLSLGGGLLGILIGHGLIGFIGPWISEAVNISVSAFEFQWAELILVPGLILLASIVGYLPAVIAYRTDVAQSLAP